MADKISGYGRSGVDVTSAKARGSARNEKAAESDKAEASQQATSASTASHVRLTDTATNLKQVEAAIARLPDVDRVRVNAVRQRVESGAYEVNAGRLADRLLAFERDLA
jgi:negative regulator of flagellin synthesis FlgM